MSRWQDYNLDEKITHILGSIRDTSPGHHLGRPFLTAYQIAIAFARSYPEDVKHFGLPIGGAGTGQHTSLAQYIAQNLSARIKSKAITNIEGGFLSNQDLKTLTFTYEDTVVQSSLTETQFTLSMFRLRD